MAITAYKTFVSGEILTASDMNSLQAVYAGANGQNVSFPRTGSSDFDGYELILDSDGDTSITADTDDQIDVRLSGTDLFVFDGTASIPVNGLTFVASAAGSDVDIQATGSDTDISLLLTPKGSGSIKLGAMIDVNGQTIGDGTRNLLTFVEDGSAVNNVEIENEATGSGPIIRAVGSDTNVDLLVKAKGSGLVKLGTAELEVPNSDGSANQVLQTNGSGALSFANAVPAGVIAAYGGASAPSGWLLCDGSAVSRATYSDLFSAISTTYGVGDGSTTFNVPDMRGRVSVGTGTGAGLTARTLGATGGAETHQLAESELAAHTHTVTGRQTAGHGASGDFNQTDNTGTANNISTSSTGGDGSHNNMQPFLVNTAIIKT